MTDDIRSVQCPNCGAPLEIPADHQRFFKCSYCGTTLEDESSKAEQDTGVYKIKITRAAIEQVPVYQAKTPPLAVETTSSGSRSIGCVISLVVLIIGIGVAGFLIPAGVLSAVFGGLLDPFIEEGGEQMVEELMGEDPSGLGDLALSSFGPLRVVDSDTDTSRDGVGVAQFRDDTSRLIYLDFENTPPLRWVSEPLPDDSSFTADLLVVDEGGVFFSFDGRVQAYDRQTGDLEWEVFLADAIAQYVCLDCLQLFPSHLVALTAEGTIQGIDKLSGQLSWSTRLNETPRQLMQFGGNVAVLDVIEDQGQVLVFDPASGVQLGTIAPQCPNEPFPARPQTPQTHVPNLVSEDGSSLYTYAGFFEPGCLNRWQAVNASPLWEATFPSSVFRSVDEDNLLLTEAEVVVANRNSVHRIGVQNGDYQQILLDEDYEFITPIVREGALVLVAERTRGTSRYELWGINLASGEVVWTYVPGAEEWYDDPSVVVREGGLWASGLTSYGLTMAEYYSDPAKVIFTSLNLSDGTPLDPVEVSLPESFGSFWLKILAFDRDEVWMTMGTNLVVVNPLTGFIINTWP